jgi:phosphatidylserine/phosphatidylglycerophosphate/cardiolipin synthase-like enzyme
MSPRIPFPAIVAVCLFAAAIVVPRFRTVLPAQSEVASVPNSVEVFFSPNGGCTEAVVRELNRAKETVLVQAYSFTSAPIAQAMVSAFRRGVKVQVILDESQRSERYSSADFVAHARIPIFIDAKHAIAHNKIIVIDGETVLTGSFNFTKAAEEHNAENLLVIHDSQLAAQYTENWKEHLEHSERYAGR